MFLSCNWSTTSQVRRCAFGFDQGDEVINLQKAARALNELIAILAIDNRSRRAVVQFQMQQIVKIARGQLPMDEGLPNEVLLQELSKRIHQQFRLQQMFGFFPFTASCL
jgi:hypothetical protein